MIEILFYAVALCAIKPGGTTTETKKHGEIHYYTREAVEMYAEFFLAYSAEEAKRKGLAVAHDRWPEADGWGRHAACVHGMDRGYVSDILGQMPDELEQESAEEGDDFGDYPELLM